MQHAHTHAAPAQVLAGALKDAGRASVVGSENTFGKGLIQTVVDLPDGSGLAITVAKCVAGRGRACACVRGRVRACASVRVRACALRACVHMFVRAAMRARRTAARLCPRRYQTPQGLDINKVGVAPTIRLAPEAMPPLGPDAFCAAVAAPGAPRLFK